MNFSKKTFGKMPCNALILKYNLYLSEKIDKRMKIVP